LKKQRYGLTGEICRACGAKLFPPRDVCPECSQPAYEPFTFSGKGEVYSYATMYHAPDGYQEFVPYTVALVRLEEGPLITAQLTDVDTEGVEIGMPVEMVTRKMREYGEDGAIVYGYKFRKILQEPV
jgi:hypothetical protein